jgi:hypothetical protein
MLMTIMLPIHVIIVPQYMLFSELGWLNTFLPLIVPKLLATTAIFMFIWTWNDFFSQLIYLTDPDKYTVPVALRSFVDSTTGTSWGQMFQHHSRHRRQGFPQGVHGPAGPDVERTVHDQRRHRQPATGRDQFGLPPCLACVRAHRRVLHS